MDGIFTSEYKLELIRACDYTQEYIESICMLYDQRSKNLKEKQENYTYNSMKSCFKRGRFNYGFCMLKHNDRIVITGGLDLFKGWAVGTRYLRHNPDNSRFLPYRAFLASLIHEHLDNNIEGFCYTQNTDQRNVTGINPRLLHRAQINAAKYGPESVSFKTLEVMKNVKKLDYLVWYRNTVQEVYTYYTDKSPPFERYLIL